MFSQRRAGAPVVATCFGGIRGQIHSSGHADAVVQHGARARDNRDAGRPRWRVGAFQPLQGDRDRRLAAIRRPVRGSAILRAAELLADAKVDVIAWNGTSASWLGFERDERLCERITEVTGIKACTSVLAFREIFERAGVRRVGLVTPYVEAVQARIVANWREAGFNCVAERHCGLQRQLLLRRMSEGRRSPAWCARWPAPVATRWRSSAPTCGRPGSSRRSRTSWMCRFSIRSQRRYGGVAARRRGARPRARVGPPVRAGAAADRRRICKRWGRALRLGDQAGRNRRRGAGPRPEPRQAVFSGAGWRQFGRRNRRECLTEMKRLSYL